MPRIPVATSEGPLAKIGPNPSGGQPIMRPHASLEDSDTYVCFCCPPDCEPPVVSSSTRPGQDQFGDYCDVTLTITPPTGEVEFCGFSPPVDCNNNTPVYEVISDEGCTSVIRFRDLGRCMSIGGTVHYLKGGQLCQVGVQHYFITCCECVIDPNYVCEDGASCFPAAAAPHIYPVTVEVSWDAGPNEDGLGCQECCSDRGGSFVWNGPTWTCQNIFGQWVWVRSDSGTIVIPCHTDNLNCGEPEGNCNLRVNWSYLPGSCSIAANASYDSCFWPQVINDRCLGLSVTGPCRGQACEQNSFTSSDIECGQQWFQGGVGLVRNSCTGAMSEICVSVGSGAGTPQPNDPCPP